MRVYLASSWRNQDQPFVVEQLRDAGHEVYDFRNPSDHDAGFDWSWIDRGWLHWDTTEFRTALQHPLAEKGYTLDKAALDWCDACVMLMPCGRSAHLELGYAVGTGKRTIVYLVDDHCEPELMYKLADQICVSPDELLRALAGMAKP
jgi:hypothetical protein